MNETDELSLLEKVLFKVAVTEDPQLTSLLEKYLLPVMLKLDSSESVRNKVWIGELIHDRVWRY